MSISDLTHFLDNVLEYEDSDFILANHYPKIYSIYESIIPIIDRIEALLITKDSKSVLIKFNDSISTNKVMYNKSVYCLQSNPDFLVLPTTRPYHIKLESRTGW